MTESIIAVLITFCFVLLFTFLKLNLRSCVIYEEISNPDINKILLQHLMPKGIFILKLNDVEYMISQRGRISLATARFENCKLIIDTARNKNCKSIIDNTITIDLSDDKEDLNKIKNLYVKTVYVHNVKIKNVNTMKYIVPNAILKTI